MKTKLLILIVFAFIGLSTNAQTQLWGTAQSGGTSGAGTIFTGDENGNNIHTVYNFVNATGEMPVGNMVMANNGKLYGVTWLGGFGDSCVCYSFDPYSGTYTDIYDLFQNTATGWDAWSGMCKSNDGNLYGLCAAGGANGSGVIYKIDPTTDTYTDIYDLTAINGGSPLGSLMQGSNNKLYGMTPSGGVHNHGTIFSFEAATATYTKLYDFDSITGYNPTYGALMQASNGKLYGMANFGGINGGGVIFSFDINANTYTVEYNFDNVHGAYPQGTLMQATDGKLYGMAQNGGANMDGVLFSYDITANTFTDLFDFDNTNGMNPRRGVKQGATGKLFGTTNTGGVNSEGVAFSYDITTATYTKILDFDAAVTGSGPDCEFTETPLIVTNVATLNNNSNITVTPNPATDYITITNTKDEQQIRFTDILGKEIGTIKTSAISKTTVDVSHYPNIFFVKSPNGAVQKIVRE